MHSTAYIESLKRQFLPRDKWPELSAGAQARIEAATATPRSDFVMSAIVGVAGLRGDLRSDQSGKSGSGWPIRKSWSPAATW